MTSFSTAAIVWVNLQLAALARLHHVGALRPVWHTTGPHGYTLTLHADSFRVSTLFDTDLLAGAFNGEESQYAMLLRTLGKLVRSVSAGT
jgi:hypothetical protein